MVIVLDDSVDVVLSNFNLDIYNNIEGIIRLLFAGSSIGDVKSVFVSERGHNTLELICDNGIKFQLLLEYKNEFFEDCIIFGNDIKEMKYEFFCDNGSNCYSLKLLELLVKKENHLKIEMLLYGYGNHINVYLRNKIFSFDIHGSKANFDFYKFEELFETIGDLNLENLLQIVQLCVDMKNIDKILIDEYERNQLVKNMVVSENNVIKTRVLSLKKKKC